MENQQIDKKVLRIIYILSIVIPVAVGLLMIMPTDWKLAIGISQNATIGNLPLMHAILNGSTFFFLVLAGIAIKNKKVNIHKTFMGIAFVLSSFFLISYVVYHTTHPSAHYGGEGTLRSIYFIILISHIILSVPVIPLALLSIYRGWTNNIAKHKKIVRFAYPVWLYVSLTGVLVYVMMQPYY
jgi:putative membrane protein